MRYAAIIYREGKYTNAGFPDCPGCQTFARGKQRIEPRAREALQGWLESFLDIPQEKRRQGDLPPRPSPTPKVPRGRQLLWIEIPTELALKLEFLWARASAEVTDKQLAKRSELSRRSLARLRDPDASARLDDFDDAFKALGLRLAIATEKLPGMEAQPVARTPKAESTKSATAKGATSAPFRGGRNVRLSRKRR